MTHPILNISGYDDKVNDNFNKVTLHIFLLLFVMEIFILFFSLSYVQVQMKLENKM